MPTKKTFLPYLEARDFIRSLHLKGKKEWNKYHKTKARYSSIPSHPDTIYKRCGWISLAEWLGTKNKQGGNRQYNVNDNYFKVWSHNMAYILGFWFADGNIFMPQKKINFSQHKKDIQILLDIKKEMGAENPIIIRGDYARIDISSAPMLNDIIRRGGSERKSLVMSFPYIPKKYLPDFIRGLWDGDGCISYDKRSRKFHSNYVSGSKKFATKMFDILKKNIPNLSGCFMKSAKNAYRIKFSTNDTVRLKKFMYQKPLKDKIMLKRKYDLFIQADDFCSCEFLEYKNAQKYVSKLGIKSREEWLLYCRGKTKPHNIPSRPDAAYESCGWNSWGEWLGTGNVYRKHFLPFKRVRKIARKLDLKSKKDWQNRFRNKEVNGIPLYPEDIYKNKGWGGWKDWLGYEKQITRVST